MWWTTASWWTASCTAAACDRLVGKVAVAHNCFGLGAGRHPADPRLRRHAPRCARVHRRRTCSRSHRPRHERFTRSPHERHLARAQAPARRWRRGGICRKHVRHLLHATHLENCILNPPPSDSFHFRFSLAGTSGSSHPRAQHLCGWLRNCRH